MSVIIFIVIIYDGSTTPRWTCINCIESPTSYNIQVIMVCVDSCVYDCDININSFVDSIYLCDIIQVYFYPVNTSWGYLPHGIQDYVFFYICYPWVLLKGS